MNIRMTVIRAKWALLIVCLLLISQQGTANIWDNIIVRVDDGPSKYSRELLETLQKLKVKNAVFYLIGKHIERTGKIDLETAQIISDIIYKYHYTVGNHTYSHPYLHSDKIHSFYENNLDKWEEEIDKTQKAINNALNMVNSPSYQCRLFATPGGPWNLSSTLEKIVRKKGFVPDSGWDIDSQDCISSKRRLTPKDIVNQIKEKNGELLTGRKIVILIHSHKDWAGDLKKIHKILAEENKNAENKSNRKIDKENKIH